MALLNRPHRKHLPKALEQPVVVKARKQSSRPIPSYVVTVDDPYHDAKRDVIFSYSKQLAKKATKHYKELGVEPKRKSKLDHENPAAKELFNAELYPAFHRWRTKQVPTAAALVPLQRPEVGHLTDGTAISAVELDWFKHSLDAIGLRSRAATMTHILEKHGSSSYEQNWLSLACGASVPVLDAAYTLSQQNHRIHVVAADFDRSALTLSRKIARNYDFQNFSTRRINVLDPGEVAKQFEADYDVVDVLGLFEYLKPNDWYYTYNKVIKAKKKLAGAINFLKVAYSLLKPGGVLVFGNMLDTHPHLDFTLKVVQWPHIQPRSVKEIVEIVEAAGISTKELSVYIPEDGVYAVYVLKKIG